MRLRPALAAMALLASALYFTATPVLASCPIRRVGAINGFAGTQGGLTGVKGVHAQIEEYHPTVGSGSTSLMWVMLNNGTSNWAQVGWWQDTSGHRVFEQHTNGSGQWFTNYWPGRTNSSNDYKVMSLSTAFSFSVNDSLLSSVTRGFTANGYQLYGETNRKEAQMAGGFSSLTTKAFISSAQKQNSSNTWSAVTTAAGANSTLYGAQLTSGTYYIWDWACAS